MILLYLLFLGLNAFLLYSWVKFMKDRRNVKLPGPLPLPILGNAHIFAVNAPRFIQMLGELAEQYGAACLAYILRDRYVIISQPQLMEIFLKALGASLKHMDIIYVLLSFIGDMCLFPIPPTSRDYTGLFLFTSNNLRDDYTHEVGQLFPKNRNNNVKAEKSFWVCWEEELVLQSLSIPILSSTEFNNKGISYSYLKPWLGEGLLTSGGYRWKSHRKFLTPAFHFNILQNFLPVFCKNTRILIQKLKTKADGTTPLDLFPIIALAALDNVTESIMGVCMDVQKDSDSKYVKAIEDLSNLISLRMRNPVLGEEAIFNYLPQKRRQDRALKILHGQTRKVIEARRQELQKMNITQLDYNSDFGIKNKHAFLDLLLLAEIDGKRIDDEKIREEVDTFMFEGHDTTTSAIVFSLFNISKYSDIQEKLLEEQRTIFGNDINRDPTYTELAQMKYLEAVIKESLRLYPSVPFIERLITQDTCVAGMNLPKNTSVILNFFHMQRRPEVYDNPEEFRPERFSEGNDKKNAFSWLSFSAGPRNCIGQKFAMMELKVTLSSIVRNFELLPHNKEPTLIADLILRSQNGVHIKLTERKH